MKSFFLSSASLVAIVMSANVHAAEVKISGEWEGGFSVFDFDDTEAGGTLANGATDQSTGPGFGNRSSNFVQESEVHFEVSQNIMDDWKAMVRIELEGESISATDEGQIDETFVRFSHDTYGTFELGNRNAPALRMVPFAASAGFQPNGGAASRIERGLPDEWTPAVASRNLLTEEEVGLPTGVNGAGGGDATKLSYITPRLFGFQLGLSFTPDGCETGISGTDPNRCRNSRGVESNNDEAFSSAGFQNIWSVAANQALPLKMLGIADEGLIVVGGSFSKSSSEATTFLYAGEIDDAGYLIDEGLQEWNMGALLRYKGFKLSGAYKNVTAGDAAPEVNTWGIGATQKLGKWEIGANYAYGEADRPSQQDVVNALSQYTGSEIKILGGGTNVSAATAIALVNGLAGPASLTGYGFDGTDSIEAWEIAANYEMGPGIKLIGAVRVMDAEHGQNAAAGEFDAVIFETGTKIEF